MFKILVPTDFSPNANLALEHAFQVANKFKGEVHVLHIYHVETRTGSFVSIQDIVHQDREKEIASLIEKMKPLMEDGIRIVSHVVKGSTVDSIIKKADNLHADLIIMGTTGAGGMKKIFLGSTASHVINGTLIPVLAIPMEIRSLDFSHIILALDTKNIDDLTCLNPLIKLVKAFKSKLVLLTILDLIQTDGGVDPTLDDFLKKEEISFTYQGISASDVVVGIQEFIIRENSDMICLLHRSRGLFERFFDQSVAKEIVFDSGVPLLVLRA